MHLWFPPQKNKKKIDVFCVTFQHEEPLTHLYKNIHHDLSLQLQVRMISATASARLRSNFSPKLSENNYWNRKKTQSSWLIIISTTVLLLFLKTIKRHETKQLSLLIYSTRTSSQNSVSALSKVDWLKGHSKKGKPLEKYCLHQMFIYSLPDPGYGKRLSCCSPWMT